MNTCYFLKLSAIAALLISLVGCAHHDDVRPSVNGVHRVVVTSEEKAEGARDAIDQAKHYCKQNGRNAAFVKEKQKYTGDMKEKTYKNAKRATKVAQSVGGAAWVFGGRKESNLGGIVSLGAAAGDAALGDGYTVDMRFKCI